MWTDSADGQFYAGAADDFDSLFIGNASEARVAVPREPLQHLSYQCSLMTTATLGFVCVEGKKVRLYSWSALSSDAAPLWTVSLEEEATAVEFINDGTLAVAVGAKVQLLSVASAASSSSSRAVFQEFMIGSNVNSLVLLHSVGLVVGSSASVQLFNASSLQAKGPAEPCATLLTNSITSVVAIDNWGLAVAMDVCVIPLFSISSFQSRRHIEPYQVLSLSCPFGARSTGVQLAFSPAGALAAGYTQAMFGATFFEFFDAERLRPHGPTRASRTITKQASTYYTVPFVAPLSNGWIASAALEGVVFLFDPVGREDRLKVTGRAVGIRSIGSGGLVVSTENSGLFLYNISTFPDQSTKAFQELTSGFRDISKSIGACLLNDSHELAAVWSFDLGQSSPFTEEELYSVASLRPNGPAAPSRSLDEGAQPGKLPIHGLWALRHSGLAIITSTGDVPQLYNTIELYNSSGGKFQTLRTVNKTLQLLPMEDGLAAAAQDGAVYIFEAASLLPSGPTAPVQRLEVRGSVRSMAVTLSGGLAVVVDCGAGQEIVLFASSSLLPGGVSRPYQSLEVGETVIYGLVASEGGGLVVAAGGTMHFFNSSAMVAEGPRQPFASLTHTHYSYNHSPSSSAFFVHKAASGFPSWFYGSDVLLPVPCPSSTYKLNDAQCRLCPSHLLSLAGSDQCDLLGAQIVACALLSAAALLAAMAGSVCLVQRCFPRTWRPCWRLVMQACPWALGSAAFAAGPDRLDWYWWWVGVVLLAARGLLALPGNEKRRRAVIADLTTLGLLTVLASVTAVQLTEDVPSSFLAVGMWTALGRARRKLPQGVAALAFIPPSIEMVWALATVQGFAASQLDDPAGPRQEALAEPQSLLADSLAAPPSERLPEPRSETPHLSLDLTLPEDGAAIARRACCRTCSARRGGQQLGEGLRGPQSRVWAGRLWRYACSWEGRQLAILVNGLISLWTLGVKLALRQLAPAAGGALVSAVALSGLVVSLGLLAILGARRKGSRVLDPHFRRGLLMKGLLMVSKTALLAMPEAFQRVEVAYSWSCIQALCPDWCTQRGGRCISQDNGDDMFAQRQSGPQCSCETTWPSTAVLVLTIATCFLMGMLTVLDLFTLLRNAGCMAKHILGAILCNLAQLSGLMLVFLLPMTALSEHPAAAAAFAAPLVPLSLALNELKWIHQPSDDIPKIELHESGLQVYVAFFIPLSCAALVFLWDLVAAQMSQPAYAAPTFWHSCWLVHLSALVLAVGLLGSLLLLCQRHSLCRRAHGQLS